MTTSTISPDAVFSGSFGMPPSEAAKPGFFDSLSDQQLLALGAVPMAAIGTGLWTWAAVAALATPGVGWTILGCFCAFQAAFCFVVMLMRIGSLFG